MKLAFLLAFAALLEGNREQDEFRISTDVVLVVLDVSVKNSKGDNVAGLPKDAFHVVENGVPQNIKVFSNADVPVVVGLVMDDSGSMRSKRADVITAGLAFAGASNPQDQIFVVNFNDKVRRGLPPSLPFTGDVALLRSALSKDPPAGMTAMYDALADSLRHVDTGQRDKKALVLVSDGGDTCSKTTLPELITLIQQSHATIYTVGVFDLDDPDRNPGLLRRIANLSGGESFIATETEQVIPICKRIAKDIRTRYTIGYAPEPAGNRAGVHKLQVTAAEKSMGKLKTHTRTTYVVSDAKQPKPAVAK